MGGNDDGTYNGNAHNGINVERFERLEPLLHQQQATIKELNSKLLRVSADKNDKVANYGGIVLYNVEEALNWVKLHLEFADFFRLLPNLHLYMASVFEEAGGDDDFWSVFKDLSKTSLQNNLNIKAISSYQRNIPTIVSKGQNIRTDASTSSFDQFKTNSSFTAATVDQLKVFSGLVKREWQESIETTFHPDSAEYTLCCLALTECHAAFSTFISFLATRRNKFKSKGYADAMAWAFATRLGHTILLEIGKPRGKMHNRVRQQNINHTAALHLLGSLRSLT